MRSRARRSCAGAARILMIWIGVAGAAGCGGDSTSAGDDIATPDGATANDAGASDATARAEGGGVQDARPQVDGTVGSDASVEDASSADRAVEPADATSGGTDGVTPESGHEGGASTGDASGETCAIDGAACGAGVLCKAGVCSPCVEANDDRACTTAYASGVSTAYVCLAGVCLPGDCRTDADCAASASGPLCGAQSPHVCGKCTSDVSCAHTHAATPACNLASGLCVGSFDAGTIDAGGCDAGACASCLPPTDNTLVVNPVSGSDVSGNGSASPGCAFRTVTHALRVVGQTPSVATTIMIVGPGTSASTVGAGETFPIALPANVTLTTSGNVHVLVPAGAAGFVLDRSPSAIQGDSTTPMVIDGQGGSALYGIVVDTGAQSTTIAYATITGFLHDGILVEGTASPEILNGVTATSNAASSIGAGLHVTASAQVEVSVASAFLSTSFSNNGIGILVDANGAISMGSGGGTPFGPNGNLFVQSNAGDGLLIQPNPGAFAFNIVQSFTASSNGGAGIHVLPGDVNSFRLTTEVSNAGPGILVGPGLGPETTDDLTYVNFGDTQGAGNNTLTSVSAPANGQAAICLEARPNSGTLKAEGNSFVVTQFDPFFDAYETGQETCSTGTWVLRVNRAGCANDAAACAGGVCEVGVVGAGNDVDVSMCTLP